MSKTVQILFAACFLFDGRLARAGDPTEPDLVVGVRNAAGFDEATIDSAEQIVTGIFRRLGIHIAWHHPGKPGRDGAEADTGARRSDLWVNLVPVTSARFGCGTNVAGFTLVPHGGPTGSLIWVFRPVLERVINGAVRLMPQRDTTRLRNVLLAHVMAHEMGHALLGSANHSVLGIMTRQLDLRSIQLAWTGGLEFSRGEAEKIRSTVHHLTKTAYAQAGAPPA